ncbi:phosphatidylserine decarboxylase [Methanolobus halotolerans]|uniref:Putative archaetidylserine decarboxylase proenzyme n=1 Tax=Methanolobus halotolerans TaxID=2052935 RepID=A0A4E0PXN0_9EURY|nr:phosphatidylserine decarboxylase [Methanolobus halotolerans]TGC10894.1 phosphatidylserine decarboxylase family protein [Methanolobus halotolerans]
MLAKGSAPWIATAVAISIFATIAHFFLSWPHTDKIALLGIATTVFFLFFFRDPERNIKQCDNVMLAPADGKIVDVRERKICIFMNFQNVHVNRAPMTGKVLSIIHKKGGYIPAFCKDSERNERSHILIETEHGLVEVIQIAGTVTRRIISYVREGDYMTQGERFGMIRFGSRVDVTIPENFEIACKKGNRVFAGITVIARANDNGK